MRYIITTPRCYYFRESAGAGSCRVIYIRREKSKWFRTLRGWYRRKPVRKSIRLTFEESDDMEKTCISVRVRRERGDVGGVGLRCEPIDGLKNALGTRLFSWNENPCIYAAHSSRAKRRTCALYYCITYTPWLRSRQLTRLSTANYLFIDVTATVAVCACSPCDTRRG